MRKYNEFCKGCNYVAIICACAFFFFIFTSSLPLAMMGAAAGMLLTDYLG
jgi:hypothetical protein